MTLFFFCGTFDTRCGILVWSCPARDTCCCLFTFTWYMRYAPRFSIHRRYGGSSGTFYFYSLVFLRSPTLIPQRVRQPLQLARRRGRHCPRETKPARRERHRRRGAGGASVASGWQTTEPPAIDYKARRASYYCCFYFFIKFRCIFAPEIFFFFVRTNIRPTWGFNSGGCTVQYE